MKKNLIILTPILIKKKTKDSIDLVPLADKYVKVKKDTFDTMKKVVYHAKRVIEVQPQIENTFQEINNYTNGYKSLEKENQNIQRELRALKNRNKNLTEENNKLKNLIKIILCTVKDFFRQILKIGNEPTKDVVTNEIKNYYDNKLCNSNDVYYIAKKTTKENELMDYTGIPSYLKAQKRSYDDKENDDFGMTL